MQEVFWPPEKLTDSIDSHHIVWQTHMLPLRSRKFPTKSLGVPDTFVSLRQSEGQTSLRRQRKFSLAVAAAVAVLGCLFKYPMYPQNVVVSHSH